MSIGATRHSRVGSMAHSTYKTSPHRIELSHDELSANALPSPRVFSVWCVLVCLASLCRTSRIGQATRRGRAGKTHYLEPKSRRCAHPTTHNHAPPCRSSVPRLVFLSCSSFTLPRVCWLVAWRFPLLAALLSLMPSHRQKRTRQKETIEQAKEKGRTKQNKRTKEITILSI